MAKEYRFGFVIEGDAEKGTKALRRTREEIDGLQDRTDKARRKTKEWRDETGKQSSAMKDLHQEVKNVRGMITGLAGVYGIGLLLSRFKETVVQTETLRGSLKTVTGSNEAAALSFDRLTKFAAQTPFTLDQSVTAFIRLKSLGLDPSERAMMSYGNTASAMGKDMMQMIEAVADASTMEFERLKEFGIRAKQEADTVTFTFQGIETTVAKNSQSIQKYLLGIGETKFGDAMADQMSRLPGMLSNLEDTTDALFRKIGDAGGISLFGKAIGGAQSAVESLTAAVDPSVQVAKDLAEIHRILWSETSTGAEMAYSAVQNSAISMFDTVKQGVAQVDEVFGTHFTNVMTGGVGVFELLEVTGATTTQRMISFARISYIELFSFMDQMKVRITMSGKEQEDALAALDRARMLSIEETLKGYDSQMESIYGAISAQAAQRESVRALIEGQDSLVESLIEGNGVTEDGIAPVVQLTDAQKDLVEMLEKSSDATTGLIGDLVSRARQTRMTAREQAIDNELLKLGAGATLQARIATIALTGAVFDHEQALRDRLEQEKLAAKAAEDLEKSSRAAAKKMAEDWADTRQAFGSFFADMVHDGTGAFDALLQSFKRMLAEMTGQLALSGILKLAGVNVPGGGSAGLSGILESSGMAGTILKTLMSGGGSAATTAAMTAGGQLGGIGATVAGGTGAAGLGAAGAAGTGMMGSMAALATNPATWAVAALMFAAENDFWKDPDGYKRSFAGMLTAPTPGAAGSTFSVDPFASGFKAQGIAHNADRATDEKYIDVYRDLDASVFELVQKLGGSVSLANATLGGVGMDGRFGTAGTFLGMGGKTTEDDLTAMVESYLSQFLDHVTGLDDELMSAVRSAGSATQAVKILSEAVEKHEETSKAAEEVAKQLVQAEEKLLAERLDGINGMSTLMRNAVDLHRSIENEINSALGASPLFKYEGAFSGQLETLAAQRDHILRNHQEQMRAEQELHNQRMTLARSFQDYSTALRLGDFSNFGSAGKFDLAQGNFRSLAMAAQGGDLEALKRLQGAAEQYVTSADQMFASSSGRKSVVSEVLGIMDALGASLPSSQYDPSAANDALVSQLQALDQQLASIAVGINQSVIAELRTMNITLSELSPKMQESLIGAIGQWVTASSPTGLAMIQALSGIKAGIDVLPPDIAMYMSSTMGQMMQAMLASGRTPAYIANQFTPGTLPSGAANNYLAGAGLGSLDDYRTTDAQILDYISSFQNAATDLSAIAQIATAANENGINADRLAGLTGFTREQIIQAAAAAGVPMFARGGYHAGGMAIVGEQGPELAQFAGPTRIFSNADSRNMMAGNAAELGEIKSALVEIRHVLIADAQFSGAQRERSLTALSGIEAKISAQSSRIGSGRYAHGV